MKVKVKLKSEVKHYRL